jgi:hypothetical protein
MGGLNAQHTISCERELRIPMNTVEILPGTIAANRFQAHLWAVSL